MVKWFLIVIMSLHGLIHLMGSVSELGIAEVKELSGQTLISLSDTMRTILGIVWFIPLILFLIATVGLGMNREWWRTIAIAAAIISQVLVIIWWPDAKWGTIPNAFIMIAAFLV
jgi:hypothetical protein